MDITVIMPVYNAAHLLPKVLAPLIAMQRRGEVLEVLAVDDVSTDNSREVAAGLGARVIESPRNRIRFALSGNGVSANVGDVRPTNGKSSRTKQWRKRRCMTVYPRWLGTSQ